MGCRGAYLPIHMPEGPSHPSLTLGFWPACERLCPASPLGLGLEDKQRNPRLSVRLLSSHSLCVSWNLLAQPRFLLGVCVRTRALIGSRWRMADSVSLDV